MTLYLDVRTNCSDLMVDFIEVQLSNGEVVSLNWDESGIDRDNAGFSARYKGVCFDEEYADGRLDDLREMKIQMVQVYTELGIPVTFQIAEMLFVDAGKELLIKCSKVLYRSAVLLRIALFFMPENKLSRPDLHNRLVLTK